MCTTWVDGSFIVVIWEAFQKLHHRQLAGGAVKVSTVGFVGTDMVERFCLQA